MQPTKATEGSSEKGDTHTQAKPTQSPRKPQYIQRRRPRGSKEREDTHTREKPTQSPRKPQYNQRRRPRGSKERGDTHSSRRTRPHYSQQRRPRETHWKPLRKTKMKRVTNDLTNTAICTPLALEKTAPPPRSKSLKKQR